MNLTLTPVQAMKLAHAAVRELRESAFTCRVVRTSGMDTRAAVTLLLSDARDYAPVIKAALACGLPPGAFRRSAGQL